MVSDMADIIGDPSAPFTETLSVDDDGVIAIVYAFTIEDLDALVEGYLDAA